MSDNLVGLIQGEFRGSTGITISPGLARGLIAAVLDNMPRAEMADAMKHLGSINGMLDAAIAAARATLLPGDAT